MIYEDLTFLIDDFFGNKVECKILSLFSGMNNSYVVFTDGEVDEKNNIILKYGKLNKIGDNYELEPDVTEEELDFIKDSYYSDLLELSKKIINENG